MRRSNKARSRRLFLEILERRTVLAAVQTSFSDFGSLTTDLQAYDPTQILVRFQPGSVSAVALPVGAQLGEPLPGVPDLYEVLLGPSLTVTDALAALRSNANVLYAEPDYEVHINLVPNDPSFNSLWALNNVGQNGGKVDGDIDGPEAWDVTTGTGSVIVAVIDTGLDYNHPDLAANVWTNSREIAGNGLDDDANGYIDDSRGWDWANNDNNPWDDNSHGTHVAGTIGAVGNNGVGVSGVDWHVKLMSLKFLSSTGSGATSNAIRALNYAVANGAALSNNSWGGGGFSQSMYDAIAGAKQKGHIFVAAAGNSGTNNDITAFYPANYDLDNVVSVAATDRYDLLASFSNFGGGSVDLAAPGVSIYSTLPGNTYGSKSGTSMAAPHATGALALVRDLHPDWSYGQVINQILTTVDPLASLAGKTVTGGRLNVARALQSAAPPALPSLSIDNVSVTEGNAGTTNALFTVSLSAASSSQITVNYATADDTAAAGSDFASASNTLTFAPGVTSQTITVVVNGDTLVEPNETFVINLSGAVNATISDGQGLGTIANDDVAVTLAIDNVSVIEGNAGTTNALFTVSLSAASSSEITVYYATADDTAAAGSDFAADSNTLTFAPGVTSQTITVAVNGDALVEPNETFVINLSGAVNATISDGQGVGTILNDDATITIGNVDVIEGNTGTTNATFSVTLSSPSAAAVTVDYATAADLATASSDFRPVRGTLVFAPGETSKSVVVQVLGDDEVEAHEDFFVTLANATNATIPNTQGAATIRNDDTSIAIDNTSILEGDNGATSAQFTVSLAAESVLAVTIDFAAASGSATQGSDFMKSAGSLTFSPGETTKSVAIRVKGDRQVEADETFFVNLSRPVNATVSDNQGLGTIVNDDGAALLAAGAPGDSSVSAEALTMQGLRPVVELAIGAWRTSGISPASENILSAVRVDISDLGGQFLGLASPGRIQVDADAAAHGWFMEGGAGSVPPGRMDLLTVLTHEFGHLLGLDHDSPGEVMADRLEPGRRLTLELTSSSTEPWVVWTASPLMPVLQSPAELERQEISEPLSPSGELRKISSLGGLPRRVDLRNPFATSWIGIPNEELFRKAAKNASRTASSQANAPTEDSSLDATAASNALVDAALDDWPS